jgi:histidinol phosphatase-like PHP family hydrolase
MDATCARAVELGCRRSPSPNHLESIERCRAKYPHLRIRTGMEVGQPHLHARELADLLAMGTFDRVIGSLPCLLDGDEFAEPFELIPRYPADAVFRDYLAEIPRMVTGSDAFDVFGHIDYPIRFWPDELQPFNPHDFEDELRPTLRVNGAKRRVLEFLWPDSAGTDGELFAALAHDPGDDAQGLDDLGIVHRRGGQ